MVTKKIIRQVKLPNTDLFSTYPVWYFLEKMSSFITKQTETWMYNIIDTGLSPYLVHTCKFSKLGGDSDQLKM